MANWKRKERTGLHRVYVPGTGWISVKPGQPLLDPHTGELVDCDADVFGTQVDNYEMIGGEPGPEVTESGLPSQAEYVLKHRGGGYYDVVNPANPDKPINAKTLRKEEAEGLLQMLLDEGRICPAGGQFVEDYGEYDDCETCENRQTCQQGTEE